MGDGMITNGYVYQIPDMEFFAGDTISIPFGFYYDDAYRDPINITACDVEWRLCPYGQYEYPALTKTAVVSRDKFWYCLVNLSYEDTKDLDYIKYSHQIAVIYTDLKGNQREFLRAEGDIIFRPRIKI